MSNLVFAQCHVTIFKINDCVTIVPFSVLSKSCIFFNRVMSMYCTSVVVSIGAQVLNRQSRQSLNQRDS